MVAQNLAAGRADGGLHRGELDQHLGAVTVVLHHLFDGFEVPDGARKAVADLFRLLGVMDMPVHMGVPVAVLMDVFVLSIILKERSFSTPI